MQLQVQAKVLERFPQRSGTSARGKEWCSQDYLVEYDFDSQYPKKIVMNFFGDKVKEAQELLRRGTIANFDFSIESREITKTDGTKTYFTTAQCYRVTVPGAQQSVPQSQPTPPPPPANYGNYEQQDDELPF